MDIQWRAAFYPQTLLWMRVHEVSPGLEQREMSQLLMAAATAADIVVAVMQAKHRQWSRHKISRCMLQFLTSQRMVESQACCLWGCCVQSCSEQHSAWLWIAVRFCECKNLQDYFVDVQMKSLFNWVWYLLFLDILNVQNSMRENTMNMQLHCLNIVTPHPSMIGVFIYVSFQVFLVQFVHGSFLYLTTTTTTMMLLRWCLWSFLNRFRTEQQMCWGLIMQ